MRRLSSLSVLATATLVFPASIAPRCIATSRGGRGQSKLMGAAHVNLWLPGAVRWSHPFARTRTRPFARTRTRPHSRAHMHMHNQRSDGMRRFQLWVDDDETAGTWIDGMTVPPLLLARTFKIVAVYVDVFGLQRVNPPRVSRQPTSPLPSNSNLW